MTENKLTVRKYMAGFITSDHQLILDCLTDDIEWYMPGFFQLSGKQAFDKEIENAHFEGKPQIEIIRMTEEKDVVVVEGSVQCRIKNGGMLDALFCDVFEMKGGKIRKLTTYQMTKQIKPIIELIGS